MEKITVVDARMGRGKTSAAIRYMNENLGRFPFIYVAPYLTEVARICKSCYFDAPDEAGSDTKLVKLKGFLEEGKNVSTTHALFARADKETLDLIEEKGYVVIIDESVPVLDTLKICAKDAEMVRAWCVPSGDEGFIEWEDPEYRGIFSNIKKVADAGRLYFNGEILFDVLSPRHFTAFQHVYVLTYLFHGSVMETYLKFFGLDYEIVGIKEDVEGPYFSDEEDHPPLFDVASLITIVGDPAPNEWDRKMNLYGHKETSLSVNWLRGRKVYREEKAEKVRKGMRSFVERHCGGKTGDMIWTTFKDFQEIFFPRGRYSSSFLPINARATNAYSDCHYVAYIANRFLNPRMNEFFATKGLQADDNVFAISELLQFIWRSAIRNGEHITLYLPSRRMRNLLKAWIAAQNTEPEEVTEPEEMPDLSSFGNEDSEEPKVGQTETEVSHEAVARSDEGQTEEGLTVMPHSQLLDYVESLIVWHDADPATVWANNGAD